MSVYAAEIQMSLKKSLVSVIVLNWNGKRFLNDCLCSLLAQEQANFEILFVDNGSNDDSVDFVKKISRDSRLKIAALKENYGFSKGNNIGLKYVNGDYVIILNNDTVVEKNFVSKLVEIAENDDTIGSVGCNILFKNNKVWFSQKFTNYGFIVPFFLQSLLGKRIAQISSRYNTNLSNSGCAVLYRKSVLDKIGGFDEDYWSNWEDWDLGYRTNLAGFKSVFIPDSLVYHIGGGSEGFPPERCVRIYRNMLFTYFKNYDMLNLLTRFPIALFVFLPLFHISWIVQQLINRPREFSRRQSLQYFFSFEKAIIQFLLTLRVFAKKRYIVQRLRMISDREIFSRTRQREVF